MKCYQCGRIDGIHALGCPEASKPREYLVPDVPTFREIDAVSAYPKELLSPLTKTCATCDAMRNHKTIGDTILAFRSFRPVDPTSAAVGVQAYSDTELTLLRLWVDEDIAPHFKILALIVGNGHVFQAVPGVPATHFSMAHRDKYHLATEINLKVNPAMRISIAVVNTSSDPHEFRGLFECKTQ